MNEKERITIATRNDFEVSTFCGSGPGGQARNKVASGVQIRHKESGAIGRASDSRSQFDNRRSAFERLTKTPQFKFWMSQKLYELEKRETMEQTVERETTNDNLRFEVKDDAGKWVEVPASHFDSAVARTES